MPYVHPSASQVRKNIRFHDQLNPLVWDRHGDMLLPVRLRLLRAALAFLKFVDLPELKISDIVITGSNAAFNYTDDSDIDVHLVVDYATSVCSEIAENFFNTKKNLWNSIHRIFIKDMNVELYIEDERRPAYSNGLYSLLHGKWLSQPTPIKPEFDDAAVFRKVDYLASCIEDLVSGNNTVPIKLFQRKLKIMRQAALKDGGEFSTNNLAYKALRAFGYLDLLYDTVMKSSDASMSLESQRR